MRKSYSVTKAVIAIILACVLIISTGTPLVFAQQNNNNINCKLSEELIDALLKLGDDEEVKVYIILKDVDTDTVMSRFRELYPREYDEYVLAKDGDPNNAFSNPVYGDIEKKYELDDVEFEDVIDGELLQNGIEYKRQVFADLYTEQNQAFADKYLTKEEQIFVSKYSPMIIASIGRDLLFEIIRNDSVIWIDLFHEFSMEELMSIATMTTKSSYVCYSLGNNGNGVKIGQIEVFVPNTEDQYLIGASITINPAHSWLCNDHATVVARIMVGQTFSGAPGAMLYSTGFNGSAISYYEGIEWLIEKSVNVINMSARLVDYDGIYDVPCMWTDHIAIQHDVHFVAGAGNNDDNYKVAIPAMAYNVIAVGGFNTQATAADNDDIMYTDSSYIEVGTYGRAEKPNIIAPAVSLWFNDLTDSGTSYAAPQVSSVIAQMCSKNSVLKTKQTAMGAILSAGAALKINGTSGSGQVGDTFTTATRVDGQLQISNIEGAGKLNAYNARNVVHQSHWWGGQVPVSNFPYTKSFYIDTSFNSINRVAIFWLKGNSLIGNHTGSSPVISTSTLAKLKLEVFDPYGNSLGSCCTNNGNFDIVQFVPSVSGYYTAKVTLVNPSYNSVEYLGIALW